MRRWADRLLVPTLLAATLGGCTFVADVAAVGIGAGAGAATGNPAVAFAVGVGSRSALRELGNYFDRVRHGAEQDAIATAAGTVPVGGAVPWAIRHTVPFGNHNGELWVAREYVTPLTTCREIVFTVADDDGPHVFTTSLCRAGGPTLAAKGEDGRWRWAQPEPAASRWHTIQ